MLSSMEVRSAVEHTVGCEMLSCNTEQALPFEHYDAIRDLITDKVLQDRLVKERRPELNEEDRAYIKSKVAQIIQIVDSYVDASAWELEESIASGDADHRSAACTAKERAIDTRGCKDSQRGCRRALPSRPQVGQGRRVSR
jgi:hypothetical protein